MKRRDFLKLPVLIPGIKKLLDDYTLPEETLTTTFLEKSLEYPDYLFSSGGPSVFGSRPYAIINGTAFALQHCEIAHRVESWPSYTLPIAALFSDGHDIKMSVFGYFTSGWKSEFDTRNTIKIKVISDDLYQDFEIEEPYILTARSDSDGEFTDIYGMAKEIRTGYNG